MSNLGELGKDAIKLCKDVYSGMSDKYGKYAVKEGEKIIKSNMSASQINRIETVATKARTKGFMKNGKRVYGKEAYTEAKNYMTNKINTVNSVPYKFGDAVAGGIRDSAKYYRKNDTTIKDSLNVGFKNSKGELRPERIAGAAFGIGVAGRVVSGGGLYKDRNGNTNIPGVPFI